MILSCLLNTPAWSPSESNLHKVTLIFLLVKETTGHWRICVGEKLRGEPADGHVISNCQLTGSARHVLFTSFSLDMPVGYSFKPGLKCTAHPLTYHTEFASDHPDTPSDRINAVPIAKICHVFCQRQSAKLAVARSPRTSRITIRASNKTLTRARSG